MSANISTNMSTVSGKHRPLRPYKYSSLWFTLKAMQSNAKCLRKSENMINGNRGYELISCKSRHKSNYDKRNYAKVIALDSDKAIILLDANECDYELKFGCARMTSLNDNVSVNVNGFDLPLKHTIELFAVFGYQLSIRCLKDDTKVVDLNSNFESMNIDLKEINFDCNQFMLNNFAVLLIERLSTSTLLYLETVDNYCPEINGSTLNWFAIERQSQNSKFINYDAWSALYSQLNITTSDVILVTGGKDVGKSSLIRFLINHYLSDHLRAGINDGIDEVYFLECDPGQTEFTPCAQISLSCVRKPILGPTCMNVIDSQTIISSSIGTTNVSKSASLYVTNLCFIMKYFMSNLKSKAPLFINTMGWINGLGLDLLVDIIKLSLPTHVIQIDCTSDRKRNFTDDLSADYVRTLSGYKFGPLDTDCDINYKLMKIDSYCGKIHKSLAKRFRILTQLSYMSQLREIIYKPIFAITPIKINWSQVYIYIMSDTRISIELVLDTLNCSWIQLCKIEETGAQLLRDQHSIGIRVMETLGQNEALGCAVIRNIDFENKCFFIISPENVETIESVNCFVRPNGVPIPDHILSEQFRYTDSSSLPYITNLNV